MTGAAPSHGGPWLTPPHRTCPVTGDTRPDTETDGALRRVHSMTLARDLLRVREGTLQAGFTAEHIPQELFAHRPILIADGPQHDDQRKRLARFFAPRVLRERHLSMIRTTADDAVTKAVASGRVVVDEVALEYSVRVASHIIGLDTRRVRKTAKRLTRFFRQPPVDMTREDLGRRRKDWALAAFRGLSPVAAFYLFDVWPAIRSHRKRPQEDIITHLIDAGYGNHEILMECLTYGTAGMITTREFISAALWRLLHETPLRTRFEQGDDAVRSAILHEIVRIDPPVGHLYRRINTDLDVGGCPFASGELVGIDVRSTNTDPNHFGKTPTNDGVEIASVDPDRELANAERAGLSFGDGPHRCPGQPLAMLEAQELIARLLQEDPVITDEPSVGWNSLVEGYEIRGLTLSFASQ